MQMLVVNPERFSNQEIAAFGEIRDANVYLAVSITDARRLLGSVRMDAVVCNVRSSEEIEHFKNTIKAGTTRVLLLELSSDVSLPEESLQDGTIVLTEDELMHRLRVISRLISENRIMDKGYYHNKQNKKEKWEES